MPFDQAGIRGKSGPRRPAMPTPLEWDGPPVRHRSTHREAQRMSTISTTRDRSGSQEQDDPYRYGWRYVKVIGPDGRETLDQVPLTLEDVLFPEEEDFIVQTDAHDNELGYLKSVFKSRLAGDPHSVELSD
jgi:hypothetical protein